MNHRGWRRQDDRHHLAAKPRASAAWCRRSTASARKPKRRSTRATRWSSCPTATMGADRVPLSSLLATGAVHHHLVRQSEADAASASWSRRARPAKCIITACWSATAPTRSIRTWRSKRCGRPGATGCSDPIEYRRRRTRSSPPIARRVAKGMLKVMAKMGISTLQSYKGARSSKRSASRRSDRPLLRRHGQPHSGRRLRRPGRRIAAPARARLSRQATSAATPSLPNPGEFHWRAEGERHMWDPRAIADLQVAARNNSADAYRRFAEHAERRRADPLRAAWPAASSSPGQRGPDSARRSGAGQGDRQAVLHRRDELRLDLGRGPRNAGHRHESPRRQEQHGRRRRRSRAVQAAAQRRLEALGDQASRLGPVRRHDLLPDQCRRTADQDLARCQAGRRWRTARPQGR